MLGKAIRKAVRVLRRGSARRDLRHRRHVASAPGAARRASSTGNSTTASSTLMATRSGGADADRASRISARGRLGRDRAGDVADHARRARRRRASEVYRFYHVPASNTAVRAHDSRRTTSMSKGEAGMKICLAGQGAFGIRHMEAVAKHSRHRGRDAGGRPSPPAPRQSPRNGRSRIGPPI